MNPALRTTWAPRGHTPRITASVSHRKTSMAGWCCYRTGRAPRLMFSLRPGGHFTAADFPRLLRRLHRFLNTKVILVWDNLTGHVRDHTVLAFLRANAHWLTVCQLPGYAPELNPAEGLWGELKNGPLANLTARTLDEVTTTARHALRLAQYQPALLNGFLAETGLTMN